MSRGVAGDIGAMGLADWWLSTFSDAEREWMADAYSPLTLCVESPDVPPSVVLRQRPLVEGCGCGQHTNRFKHLSLLATWFNAAGLREVRASVSRKVA